MNQPKLKIEKYKKEILEKPKPEYYDRAQHEKDLENNKKRKIEGFFDSDEHENVVKSYHHQKLRKLKPSAKSAIEYNKTPKVPGKPIKYSLKSSSRDGTVKLVPDRKVT